MHDMKKVMSDGYGQDEDDGDEPESSYDSEREAFAAELEDVLKIKPEQAERLTDALCALILAEIEGGGEEPAAPKGKKHGAPSLAIVLGR